MIAGPLLLLGGLLLAALALYLVRRLEPLAALLAAVFTAALAVMLWRLPLTAPVRLAGRQIALGQPVTWEDLTLQITPASQVLLVFLLGVAAVTFILAWRTYQGRTFYPFGMALLALWAVMALVQPLTLAPLAIGAGGHRFGVSRSRPARPGETRGAWRQLLFPTLAAPLFLVAGLVH